MAGRIRWRARSGAGLGQAGEGAGKLEQLRKVPKIPGGGGARGGGPGNDVTGHAPWREGREVLSSLARGRLQRLCKQRGNQTQGRPRGVAGAPPPLSRAGAGDWGSFKAGGRS